LSDSPTLGHRRLCKLTCTYPSLFVPSNDYQ
jgi:hypothetical protein